MSFSAFGFPPNMTTMTGNTVLKWWATDIPILAVGIPHKEFITNYCPHARPQGIVRLDGHRLVINRRGDLAVTKVKRRRPSSTPMTTTTTARPTEDTTSPWSATLESPSLPKDPTTNDNNTYRTTNTTTNSPTVRPSTKRPSAPRQRSFPFQAPGAWPESNLTPTPAPNPTPTPDPIPDTDLSNSATSSASSSTIVSRSHGPAQYQNQNQNQNQNQQADNDPRHQVWGIVYLLTRTQYDRFQRQHLSPPQPQPHLRPRQPRQPQLCLPRQWGIPMIFTRQNEAQPSRVTRNLPEVQVHFFQHDLLRQSAARQHVFPETAGDAVQRHLSEVRDLRLVRVLIRHRAGAGDDDDDDAVAEAVSDAVAGDGYSGGEGTSEGELTWREQREKERREEMVSGLTRWTKDLVRRGVPTNWVREVMARLIERVESREVDIDWEEEELEVITSRVDDEEEGVDEWQVEGQIIEAMDSIARNIWGASREVLGMARRGVGELLAHLRGEEEGEEEEWELVEYPDQRGRGRWR